MSGGGEVTADRPTRVLLYSGGQDSMCLRHLWRPDVCLYVDMGTAYTGSEIERLDPGVEVVRFDLSRWELEDKIIPLRNLFLVALAAQYGGNKGAVEVALGATAGDRPLDKSPAFANLATNFLTWLWSPQRWTPGKAVRVVTPAAELSKGDLVAAYVKNHGDVKALVEGSYSCYTGGEPCGACKACARRWAAFACNGIASEPNCYDYVKAEVLPGIQDGSDVRERENNDILKALAWVESFRGRA